MIKISHESPISLLEESRSYNDYCYALVHLFEEQPAYFDFYKKSVEMGRHVLLDNSIFELGIAFDPDRYAYWIKELKPTEYIIPDVLEDCKGTISNVEMWMEKYSDLPGKKIGVVQGKHYCDFEDCYQYLDQVANVDKIAFSFDYSFFVGASHPNKFAEYTIGRVQLLNNLLEDKLINTTKPHHLLGCGLPIEFMFYRDPKFNWIETLDTSNPVVHGILGIEYEPCGLLNKQSIKLVELLNTVPTEEQLNIIRKNISLFRTYVNGV